jgi:hypothetical protein
MESGLSSVNGHVIRIAQKDDTAGVECTERVPVEDLHVGHISSSKPGRLRILPKVIIVYVKVTRRQLRAGTPV